MFRHILQLHHVHGGLERGDHHHDTELPPPLGRHSRDAKLGELTNLVKFHDFYLAYFMFDVVLCSGAFFSSFVDTIHASEVKLLFVQLVDHQSINLGIKEMPAMCQVCCQHSVLLVLMVMLQMLLFLALLVLYISASGWIVMVVVVVMDLVHCATYPPTRQRSQTAWFSS